MPGQEVRDYAAKLAKKINAGNGPSFVLWNSKNKIHVVMGKALPPGSLPPSLSLEQWRRQLRPAIAEELAELGWEIKGGNRFWREGSNESESVSKPSVATYVPGAPTTQMWIMVRLLLGNKWTYIVAAVVVFSLIAVNGLVSNNSTPPRSTPVATSSNYGSSQQATRAAPEQQETYNERTNSDSMESGAATDEEESTDPYGMEWLQAFNDRLANKPELTMWDMPSAYRTISNPSGFILEIEEILDDGHALGRLTLYGCSVNGRRETECGFILENDYSDEYRGGIEMLYVLFPDDSTMMFMLGGECVLYSEDDYSVILRPIADSSDVAPARSTTTTSTDVVSPQPSQSISVSKWDTGKPWYGENWPFTMSSGTIELVGCCSVIFKCEGIVYALNGTARQDIARTGWTDISYSPLWRDYPSGGKVIFTPLITLALSLRR